MSESKVTNKPIQDWLLSEGAYVFKTIASNKAGILDIIFCMHGHFGSIEGKVKDGIASHLQEQNIKLIRAAGGFATVAHSFEEARSYVMAWKASGYDPEIGSKVGETIKRTL